MSTITQSTPILATTFSTLMAPPYNWSQADVDDAINLINQSPLLVSQLLDIQNKNWAILIGNNQGDYTYPSSTPLPVGQGPQINQAYILISDVSSGDEWYNTYAQSEITVSKAAMFVSVLSHEIGHAEDKQLNTISYSGNDLAPGAELALLLLSEGKAQTNNIRIEEEMENNPNEIVEQTANSTQIGIDSGNSPLVQSAIEAQVADIAAGDFSQAIIDGAESYLYETQSGTNEKYLVSYWQNALKNLPTNTPANILEDLQSINMADASGLLFLPVSNTNPTTDIMTISFSKRRMGERSATHRFRLHVIRQFPARPHCLNPRLPLPNSADKSPWLRNDETMNMANLQHGRQARVSPD